MCAAVADLAARGRPAIERDPLLWIGLVLLAHAYHRIDLNLLWDIAIDDLPRLAEALGPIVNHGDPHT